jgi:hypothetical protein
LEDAGFSWRSLIDLQQTVAQPSPGSATARKRQKKASGYDSRRSRNNENDTHVAINGATSESRKRYEPVGRVRRGVRESEFCQ